MKRWTLGVVVAVAVVLGLAAPAGALPDWMPNPLECPPGVPASKTPPTPTRPNDFGWMSGLVPHDKNIVGDPFDPNSNVSILDQYGYAGLEWHTYDLGCGGDLQDPWTGVATQFANWVMLVPITALQAVGFVGSSFGDAEWVTAFDGIFEQVARAVAAGPFQVLFPVATMLIGLLLVRKARRQSTADAVSDVSWWLLLGFGAVVLLAIPTHIARQTDGAFDYGMDAMRSAFGAGAGPLADVGPVHRDTLYVAWCTGALGSAESPAAQRYCPELFKAQAFSWQELRDLEPRGVDAYRQAVEDKQRQWMQVAESVEREYPDAYPTLQGKARGVRPMAAWGATFDVAALSLFLLWAGLSFVIARFTIRVVIVLAPLAAILGVFPSQRHRMIDLWNTLTAALVRAAVSLFVAGLVSVLIGAVRTTPGTSQVTRLVASAFISWAAWKVTGPFRRAGMLGTGAWRAAKTIGFTALGTKLGTEAGVKAAGGLPPWREPTPTPASDPLPPPPRGGYDAAHTRVRGTTPGGTYRPASPPLNTGMTAIEAVPTSVNGEPVYRTKERPAASPHRRVNDEPSYRHARTGTAGKPAGSSTTGSTVVAGRKPQPPRVVEGASWIEPRQ